MYTLHNITDSCTVLTMALKTLQAKIARIVSFVAIVATIHGFACLCGTLATSAGSLIRVIIHCKVYEDVITCTEIICRQLKLL